MPVGSVQRLTGDRRASRGACRGSALPSASHPNRGPESGTPQPQGQLRFSLGETRTECGPGRRWALAEGGPLRPVGAQLTPAWPRRPLGSGVWAAEPAPTRRRRAARTWSQVPSPGPGTWGCGTPHIFSVGFTASGDDGVSAPPPPRLGVGCLLFLAGLGGFRAAGRLLLTHLTGWSLSLGPRLGLVLPSACPGRTGLALGRQGPLAWVRRAAGDHTQALGRPLAPVPGTSGPTSADHEPSAGLAGCGLPERSRRRSKLTERSVC